MNKILALIIVTFIIILQGCNDHKLQNDKEKHANLLKTNKISEMFVHEIWFDQSGIKSLKRIAWQESFNEYGFLVQRITPKYKEKTLVDINSKKVGDISDYLTKTVETDSATGFSDTTFYFYNNKNQLIKQNSVSYKSDGSYYASTQSTNEYDDYGNIVKSCHVSDMFLGGKGCNFTSYVYGQNGKIQFRVDSSIAANRITNSRRIPIEYLYNSEGDLVYDGSFRYKYDKYKNIIQKLSDNPIFNSEDLNYDSVNNLVRVTAYKLSNLNIRDTLRVTYIRYNEKGLETEYKEIGSGKMKVFQFEYKK